MSPDTRFRLEDMRRFAQEAIELLGERSAAEILGERIRELALVRLVELVGEAAARISDEARREHPNLPWREAVGLRNILIHGYGQIKIDIVVGTVREHFPPLVEALGRILGGQGQ